MKFSYAHEWVEIQDDIATVGITNFGRMHLGEIVNVQFPEIGKKIKKNQAVVVLESNKAAVDVHSPMSGEIVKVNEELKKDLTNLNTASETKGWLFKLKILDIKEYDDLLDFDEYEKRISE